MLVSLFDVLCWLQATDVIGAGDSERRFPAVSAATTEKSGEREIGCGSDEGVWMAQVKSWTSLGQWVLLFWASRPQEGYKMAILSKSVIAVICGVFVFVL